MFQVQKSVGVIKILYKGEIMLAVHLWIWRYTFATDNDTMLCGTREKKKSIFITQ
jgi:hypothetical protein